MDSGEMKELHEAGTPYRDMTVLYRAHYVTRAVEEVLLGEKIPYTIYSGVQFFDRMEIKDALSYLRMIAYKDDLSFRRIVNVPKRESWEAADGILQEYAERQGRSLYQALQDNLEDPLFKGTGAGRFVGLIESFAAGYGETGVRGAFGPPSMRAATRRCSAPRAARNGWTIWRS